MDNMSIYEKVRAVPSEALKTIGAGRLKGMSDINPMWRIKMLTELFGASGEGWYFSEVRYSTHTVKDEVVVICEGSLRYIDPETGKWSEPIYGVGGSKMAVNEKNGLYIDDEAFKKAYTDMQSVACKALGMGANVYWNKDATKYTRPNPGETPPEKISKKAAETLSALMRERTNADKQQTLDFFAYLQGKYGFKKFEDVTGDKYVALIDEITAWWPAS